MSSRVLLSLPFTFSSNSILGLTCEPSEYQTKTLYDLHVVDGLDSKLVCRPVGTDGDGGEIQLPQVDPVDGAGAGVLIPISDCKTLLYIQPGNLLHVGREYED